MDQEETSGVTSGRGPVALVLSLYQTGMFLLAVLLQSLAEIQEGLNLEQAQSFIYSILGMWGVVILLGCTFRDEQFLRLRVTGDFIVSLALVWWTGGVESFFLPILFANVLAASTFFGYRRALLIGSSAIVVLSVITVGQLAGWSPSDWMGLTTQGVEGREFYFISCLLGQAIGIQVIAFLGSRLMGRLRRALGINDLIVHNIGEGIVALDGRKRVILMNSEALRILGYDESTPWMGRRPEQVFRRTEDAPIVDAFLGGAQELCLEWKGPRGQRVPLRIRVRQVRCDADKQEIWVALIHDETLERRALEAEARVRHLEELEDMSHGLAHEIRNPLGSIRGCVQELARDQVSAEQSEKLTRIVLRESDRLDRIVSEFMDYSSSKPILREHVNMSAVIEEVVESIRQRPEAKELGFEVDTPEDAALVLADRELLYRVFFNLGLNAVEARRPDGLVRFRVVRNEADDWHVVVEDNGVGMDESVRSRIFNPYFTTKTREGGLGLSIVEKILHGHGGSIEVTSTKGEGTRFTVWLPRIDTETNNAAQREKKLAGAAI